MQRHRKDTMGDNKDLYISDFATHLQEQLVLEAEQKEASRKEKRQQHDKRYIANLSEEQCAEIK